MSCQKEFKESKAPPKQKEVIKHDMFAAADLEMGKKFLAGCRACHDIHPVGTVNKDGLRFSGPTLFGVVGREIGTLEGYQYSPAMAAFKGSGKKWTIKRLSLFIKSPTRYIPRNHMKFGGMFDPQDRMDLIAYLATLK